MSRILILGNDEPTRAKAHEDLARLGYETETCGLREVEDRPKRRAADVVLVDLSGFPTGQARPFRALRSLPGFKDTPIIALLSESQLERLDFAHGADDFVLVPWDVKELDVRIKQALWRAGKMDADHVLRVGDVVINLANFEVTLKGQPIDLTYKEYELLRFLASHKERVHTRDTLLDQVWGYDYFGGTRTVDVHVRRVRAKIGDPDGLLIQTVRNVGYRLTDKDR